MGSEKLCPVCESEMRESKNSQGFYYCGTCHSLINHEINKAFNAKPFRIAFEQADKSERKTT